MRDACRRLLLGALSLIAVHWAASPSAKTGDESLTDFTKFIIEVQAEARSQGIADTLLKSVFADMTPDAEVADLTKRQPEYTKPIGQYLERAVTKARVARGRKMEGKWAPTLTSIRDRFGVPSEIVLATWGIETDYGGFTGKKHVIRSLATLAFIGYRPDYFRSELINALAMLDDGDVSAPQKLRGSWAGAMGNPQFMPSSFRKFAVDFDEDGTRDIWDSIPDSLCSIANYLAANGWQSGTPWGFEVLVPAGFDYMRSRASAAEWRRLGVHRVDKGELDGPQILTMFFPAGSGGPAFLVSQNFEVLKTYNNSDAYALAVIDLANRIAGRPPFQASWPSTPPLPRETRIELQKRLAALGFPVKDFDGRIDFVLRDAIRQVQFRYGFVSDGNPTPALMEALRQSLPQP